MSNLTSASGEAGSVSSNQQSFISPNSHPNPNSSSNPNPAKKKRNLPGNPDPDAEVIALSPRTLLATNCFNCEICNKGFQREQNLQLHRRGHNLLWKQKQQSSKDVIHKKVYICPETSCVHHGPSRAFGDLTGIKKHFCRKHGEKKWKCEKCSKKYAVRSDWKAHSKICGTREYRCNCGTLFSRRDSFINHRAFCDSVAEESARVALEWDIQSVPPSSAISFIGRENEKESIIGLLMQGDAEERKSYCVISIVGELGVGKTTIAHAVYDDSRVLDTFDVRIFISMSRKFDDKQLMKAIIETITESSCEITESDILGTIIKEEFSDKRFLIVLDEVTFENKGSLNFLRLLNISGKGSVVLITTCSTTIAEVIGSKMMYNLNYLLRPCCLEIIKSIAFVGKDPNAMDDFIWICKDLVTRSGHTPLCLKVLGGLLKYLDLEEWGEVLESDCWRNNKLGGDIFPALRVCYEYLPSSLKSCFSCFSLFPENYVFQKDEIICLWLSQGFIEPIEGKELEDISCEYFDELLGRLFIEESHIGLEGGKFVMHVQIHDLAKHVSMYEYLRLEDHMQMIPEHIRHFSFVPSGFPTLPIKHMVREAKNLQSFLVLSRCFWNPISTIANFIDLSDLIQKFRNLRTLSLSNIGIEELPNSIGSLQNLSYLGLNNTRLKIIPLEISGLKNLQTLEAANCYLLDALPRTIKELINLRHLDVTKGWGHVKMPVGIGNLSNLRSLPAFNVGFDPLQSSIGELKSLELLRGSLHISGLENEMSVIDAKEANLAGKFFLEKLSLQWSPRVDYKKEENGEDFVGMVLENLKPCYNLHELVIRNYMGSKFPTWMGDISYSKLGSVILDNCPSCDMFPAFGSLPVLKYLSVQKLYGVKEIRALGKFPSLQLLNLWDMYELETFEVKVGDFPCLQTLSINRCHKLRSIPCIPSLVHLYLYFCSEVPDIPELPLLEFLKVEGFKKTEVIHLPTNLPVLKNVEVLDCGELRSLEDISKLMSIEKFKIIKCPKLDLNINWGRHYSKKESGKGIYICLV